MELMTVRTVHTSMLLIATASTYGSTRCENNQAEELDENFSESEASNEQEGSAVIKMMT